MKKRKEKTTPNNQNVGLSASERKGLLLLIPLVIVISIVLFFVKRIPDGSVNPAVVVHSDTASFEGGHTISDSSELFHFDPNTADLRTLLRLGLPAKTAVSVIRYRESGKVLSIKEDLAACYGMSSDDYFRLEPYIVIGDRYRRKPKFDPKTSDYEAKKQSPAREYAAKEYDSLTESLVLVDINSADSALLRSVRGIGAYTVGQIIDYRQRIGGFVCDSQLLEVKGMRNENFELIRTQIFVDSFGIQKIDVNFATQRQLSDALSRHPYAGSAIVRKLLKMRQLKGGWRSIGDMVEDEILTQEQAARLAPYLVFN